MSFPTFLNKLLTKNTGMGTMVALSGYLSYTGKFLPLARILYFVGKICSSIAFAGVFVMAAELYPTCLRTSLGLKIRKIPSNRVLKARKIRTLLSARLDLAPLLLELVAYLHHKSSF